MQKYKKLSKKSAAHGFEVSDFYWGDKLIDNSIIERIKEAVRG